MLFITAGCFLMALATNLFYTPVNVVPGGFTGLAMIIRRLTAHVTPGGIPIWALNILLNVPLILFSIRIRGFRFIKRTLIAALLLSLFLFLIPEYPLVGEDWFLIAAIGGALMGTGMGLVFLGKATTGGTDTLAALIQFNVPHLSVAKILPYLDGAIICLSAFIFGIQITLYAIITVIVSGKVADSITGGAKNAHLAFVISDSYQKISQTIFDEMDRGATLLSGKGMYTGSEKPVLMCAVSKKEAVLLKEIVYEIDPSAFMILSEVNEIRGEGFLQFSKDEL